MTLPTDVADLAVEMFTAWREHPDFAGEVLIPRAHFFVDGLVEAIIMFPGDDVQPLAKSLYDVTGCIGPLGDGIVVYCETWMKTPPKGEAFIDNYERGDLAKDAESGQALILMKITADTLEMELLPFGVDDHGIVTWGERIDLTGAEAMGGLMPETVAEAQADAAPMHAKIAEIYAEMREIGARLGDEDEFGNGPVYRGALSALAEKGDYIIAITETLAEMK